MRVIMYPWKGQESQEKHMLSIAKLPEKNTALLFTTYAVNQ